MIFLDTSFLVAFCLNEEQNHAKAMKINEKLQNGGFGEIYISEYIFDETMTLLLSRTGDLQKVADIGEHLLKNTEMLAVGGEAFNVSWRFFKEQRHTYFSFTDCTTINILATTKINSIVTFDKEFKLLRGITVVDS